MIMATIGLLERNLVLCHYEYERLLKKKQTNKQKKTG